MSQMEGDMGLCLVHSSDKKTASSSMKPDLLIVHSAEKEINVASHTVVIKNESLARHYKGGMKGFMDKYRARCNINITVKCFIGFYDGTYELLKDLRSKGLKFNRDYIYFDTARYLSLTNWKRSRGITCLDRVDTGVKWLKGRLLQELVYVQYCEY